MVANTSARRAARAHLIFNTVGVLWMLMILPYFLEGIASLNMWLGGGNPLETDPALAAQTIAAVPVSLSLFHTIFNVLNVLIMIWFARFIVKIVTRLVPTNESEEEEFKLQHIKTGMLSTPEASLFQAKMEISLYAKHTKKMFCYVKDAFNETNEKNFTKLYDKVDKLEDENEDMEIQIADYLTKVSETRLSPVSSKRVRAFFKMVDDIESIGD